ncbi:tyrosine-type recombinase/integrase [Nocardia ignorata]|uniref:Phage integrase family protein n=1 Tax=Nocardia ignorata TaxID=145285 RepID=A0A4R6P5N8_NOCIG|nr:tyrosine-type recombinase/integrase [Nocardia ignorata]TDP33174.1 phage integrase family protein [Nocardia ignorata]
MSQIELAPGVPGNFSEPKWNAARRTFQIYCLVGEPYGEPSKLHASGNSKPKARANLKRRIAEWKPRAESLGTYSSNVTVEELCQAWLHRYERDATKRPQNAKHYRREIYPAAKGRGNKDKITISGSVLGKMRASETRPFHVRIHLEQMTGTAYKKNRQKSILRNAFQLLIDDGLRDDNPVNSVAGKGGATKVPSGRAGLRSAVNPYFADEPRPFSADEMNRYWEAERCYFPRPNACRWFEQRYMDFTLLAYELAARPSEALAVRLDDDVDYDRCEVTVAGTIIDTELRVHQVKSIVEQYDLRDDEIVFPRGWPDFDDEDVVCVAYRQPFTKTAKSMRTIKVGPACMVMLRRRRIGARPGHRLVLPSRTGKVVRSEQMSLTWSKVVKETGLQWSTPRTLRSTRATRVAEQYDLPAARLILGHEVDSPVTAQHYVPDKRRVVDLADAR